MEGVKNHLRIHTHWHKLQQMMMMMMKGKTSLPSPFASCFGFGFLMLFSALALALSTCLSSFSSLACLLPSLLLLHHGREMQMREKELMSREPVNGNRHH